MGYVGLAVAITGLIVMSLGSTPWVLAAGLIIWFAAAALLPDGPVFGKDDLLGGRPSDPTDPSGPPTLDGPPAS